MRNTTFVAISLAVAIATFAAARLVDNAYGFFAGYVVLQHATRQSRPVKAYLHWAERIPGEYRAAMKLPVEDIIPPVETDPYCLAQLKHYRSLMPLAMEADKPIFHLKPADGAIGAHVAAVEECRKDFLRLARRLAAATELPLPAVETLV